MRPGRAAEREQQVGPRPLGIVETVGGADQEARLAHAVVAPAAKRRGDIARRQHGAGLVEQQEEVLVTDQAIRYEVSDHVATITIDRPEKRNAMSFAVLGEFHAATARAADEEAARAGTITGAGGACARGTRLGKLPGPPSAGRAGRGRGPTERGRGGGRGG